MTVTNTILKDNQSPGTHSADPQVETLGTRHGETSQGHLTASQGHYRPWRSGFRLF